MRIDELQRELASARDEQVPADVVNGRDAVDLRVRRHRNRQIGVVVLVLALVVGAGAWLATSGTDEQRVISTPGDVPRYVPDPVPAGGPFFVREFPVDITSSTASSSYVRQDAVWTSDASAMPSASSPVLHLSATRVEGGGVQPSEPSTQELGNVVVTSWVDPAGVLWSLAGRFVDRASFDAAQATVRNDATGAPTLDAPSGFREVVRITFDSAATLSAGELDAGYPVIDTQRPGYVVVFDDVLGYAMEQSFVVGRSYAVGRRPPSFAWLTTVAARSLDPESIDVRGKPGYLMRLRGATSTASPEAPSDLTFFDIGVILFWWEDGDLLISTMAPTEDEARALAESLREVDEAEWQAFRAAAEQTAPSSPTETAMVGTAIAGPSSPGGG